MHTRLLFVVAAVAMASPLLAQSASPHLHRGSTPLHGSYSMESGFAIQQPAQAPRSGPETLFDTVISYYYYLPANSNDEYVDEGAFALRGTLPSEQVNGLEFSYCSGLFDPFGTALDTELRFYDDTDCNTGPTAAATCSYSITGLPGDTNGFGLSCWSVTLDLEGGFECTLPQESTPGGKEPWGWSMVYLDPTNTTGAFLARPPGGYGSQSCFWDRSNNAAIVFGGGQVIASFGVKAFGNLMDTRAFYARNPLPGDKLSLTIDQPAKANTLVTYTVSPAAAGTNYLLLASAAPTSSYPSLGGGAATLLLATPLLAPTPLTMVVNGSEAIFSAQLPSSLPPLLVTQAVSYQGVLSPANVLSASQALEHH